MPALGPPPPRYTITHKRLKRDLKIMVADHDTGEEFTFKLSLRQWDELTHAVPFKPEHKLHGRWELRYPEKSVREALEAKGIVERVRYADVVHQFGIACTVTHLVYGVLTPFGRAVRDAIPECPPEAEWPSRSPSSPTDTPKPTKAQQRILDDWPTVKMLAVPMGADHQQLSRWADVCRRRPNVSLVAMAQKGLLEVGVAGVDVVDGKLAVTGHPELVYRPTVLGAFMSK